MALGSQQRGVAREAQRAPMRQIIRGTNKFALNESKIPPDRAYQWVATSILGQPVTDDLSVACMNGFTPVPPERHPELMVGRGEAKGDHILRGGQILMERPIEIHRQSEDEDRAIARAQLQGQRERLMLDGFMAGRSKISRSYAPADPDIIDDE